jgi:hemolysin III
VWHFPLETWSKLLMHKWRSVRIISRKIYSFHLRHHANMYSNEAISGFFGLPIPDWLFRTYVPTKTLYEQGEHVQSLEDFKSPRPLFLIRWMDRATDWIILVRKGKLKLSAA